MDCLRDYIGLTGCGATVPASGLFINSLPGISLKSIDSLADTEQVNYIGVWNDIQTRAIKRLELALMSEIGKNYKIKSAKFQTSTHTVKTSLTATPIDNIQILFKSDCYSPLQYHYINEFDCDIPANGDIWSVTIKDWDTGEILFSLVDYPTFGGASKNIIPINKKLYRQNISVLISISYGSYYSTPIQNISTGCGSIQFGKNASGNFINTSNSYGCNIIGYSTGCDTVNVACDNKQLYALPLWYLLGSEFMMERMTSSRVNMWTMDRKQAEELKAFYDVESEKALKLAFNGISMNDCDCCIDCDPPIAIREANL